MSPLHVFHSVQGGDEGPIELGLRFKHFVAEGERVGGLTGVWVDNFLPITSGVHSLLMMGMVMTERVVEGLVHEILAL